MIYALGVGAAAARRAYASPGELEREKSLANSAAFYDLAYQYYRGQMFDGDYSAYIRKYGLYTHTRLLYNPVPSIINFYVDHLYPGVMIDSSVMVGEKSTPISLAMPLLDTTPDDLKIAIAQLDQWSNWLSEAQKLVRFAANTGNVLVEVEDNLERETVGHRLIWPSYVTKLVLDSAENVKQYAYEYKVYDAEKKETFTYGREVSGEIIREFRDGKPFNYGQGAEYDNPYSFAPAVWVKHEDDGQDSGIPAITSYQDIDEINSMASHVNDHVHKAIESPKVISGKGKILPVLGAAGESDANPGKTISTTGYDPRFDWMVLRIDEGAAVHDLGGTLDLAKADPSIDRLLKSFENKYVELQAAELLKDKAQMSGAFLERLLAPAQSKLDRAASSYNQQVIKLKQMQTAIGGYRFRNGWTRRDEQQKAFAPFDLSSYVQGRLNFGLKRSLLVSETESEKEDLRGKKITNSQNAKGLLDLDERLKGIGIMDEEKRKAIIAALAAETPATTPPSSSQVM